MSRGSVESGKWKSIKSGKEGLAPVKPNWVCYLVLIEVRLPLSHRCWETEALSSGVGWNSEFFWQSWVFPGRHVNRGQGQPRGVASSCYKLCQCFTQVSVGQDQAFIYKGLRGAWPASGQGPNELRYRSLEIAVNVENYRWAGAIGTQVCLVEVGWCRRWSQRSSSGPVLGRLFGVVWWDDCCPMTYES